MTTKRHSFDGPIPGDFFDLDPPKRPVERVSLDIIFRYKKLIEGTEEFRDGAIGERAEHEDRLAALIDRDLLAEIIARDSTEVSNLTGEPKAADQTAVGEPQETYDLEQDNYGMW